jgi:hypothetical protein
MGGPAQGGCARSAGRHRRSAGTAPGGRARGGTPRRGARQPARSFSSGGQPRALDRLGRSGAQRARRRHRRRVRGGDPAGHRPAGRLVQSRHGLPAVADETLRYVKTHLRGEHVRASAAIPVLFPTVQVTTPRHQGSSHRRRNAAEQRDQAGDRPRRRQGDRDRVRAVRAPGRPALDDPRAEHRRRRCQRHRRPAGRPGGGGPAAAGRDQLLLRRGAEHGTAGRRPRVPDVTRTRPVPPDLVRARGPAAAGRDRASSRGNLRASLRRPARPARDRLCRHGASARRGDPLPWRVSFLPALRPGVHARADGPGPARRPTVVAPPPPVLVPRRRPRPFPGAGRAQQDPRRGGARGVPRPPAPRSGVSRYSASRRRYR